MSQDGSGTAFPASPQSTATAHAAAVSGGRRREAELTRGALSGEAQRLRDQLRLPLELLPHPRRGGRADLRAYVLDLNRLIAGGVTHRPLRSFVERHLPAASEAGLDELFQVRYQPLWRREEIVDLARDLAGLEREWRGRGRASRLWGPAFHALNEERTFAEVWRTLTVGDFDLSGRGQDYTTGMEYFQAARSFGIETLMEIFGHGANSHGALGGVYLDVLGGDGYILRIFEACRKLREQVLVVLPVVDLDFPPTAAIAPAVIQEAGEGLFVLALEESTAVRRGRLLGLGPRGLVAGEPFVLSDGELAVLANDAAVAWPAVETAVGLEGLLAGARRHLRATGRRRPLVVTNDLSPHMFFSAGLWGFATREDAHSLSRTFRSASLDGVLFAYGTHHITGMDDAIRECSSVLRPGGRIVVHDFLDEGQVGRWFHEVVHHHSRTGHDFPHLGPVQMAAYLYLAGFREVEMYEMEDPFIFAVPDGAGQDARDVACTYLLGMYGMGQSLGGDRGRFEDLVREYLSYPEIGNVPFLAPDLAYIPRRSTVVTGVRPVAPAPFSESDRALIARLGELLNGPPGRLLSDDLPPEIRRAWLPEDGSRWGLRADERERWGRWVRASRL